MPSSCMYHILSNFLLLFRWLGLIIDGKVVSIQCQQLLDAFDSISTRFVGTFFYALLSVIFKQINMGIDKID